MSSLGKFYDDFWLDATLPKTKTTTRSLGKSSGEGCFHGVSSGCLPSGNATSDRTGFAPDDAHPIQLRISYWRGPIARTTVSQQTKTCHGNTLLN
eukprot:3792238-Amphidinium_carterae.2